MIRLVLSLFFVFSFGIWVNAQQSGIAKAKITFEFPSKDVNGNIEGFESESQIDWDNPTNSIFKGSVSVGTLDTNNGLRNWSLRGSRYFNAKTYPKIHFVSREIRKTENVWSVVGDLTLKGTTKAFTIEFKEDGNKLIGNAQLYSSDFGINIKKKREDNLVKVLFEFELVN